MKKNIKIVVVAAVTIAAVAVVILASLWAGIIGPEKSGEDIGDPEIPGPDYSPEINRYVYNLSNGYVIPDTYENVSRISDENASKDGYILSAGVGKKYEYSTKTSHYGTSDLLTLGAMDTLWYPGALVSVSNDDGANTLRVVNLPRDPMTISLNLESASNPGSGDLYCTVENPDTGSVRNAIKGLLQGAITEETEIPATIGCTIVECSSSGSFNQHLGISGKYCSFKASIEEDYKSEQTKTAAALVFMQIYFTIDMNSPIKPSDLFDSSVTLEDLKSAVEVGNQLAYVSAVYGRVIIVEIESDSSYTDLKAGISMSYSKAADLEADFRTTLSRSGTSMKYTIYGGSSASAATLITSSNVKEVAKMIADSKVVAPKPIGYRFYYVDGSGVANIVSCETYVTRKVVEEKIVEDPAKGFSGGSGTVDDPFIITDWNDLRNINTMVTSDSYYRLGNDIDKNSAGFKEWSPIGYLNGEYQAFRGHFDGNDHSIGPIEIQSTPDIKDGNAWVGLFGLLGAGSTIKNTNVNVDINIPNTHGGDYVNVGGIAGGSATASFKIVNCHSSGSIVCDIRNWKASSRTGGIVGYARSGTIDQCSNEATVSMNAHLAYVGGIAGETGSGTTVRDCHNSGNVSSGGISVWSHGDAYSGGIVGLKQAGSQIINCVNTGVLKATNLGPWPTQTICKTNDIACTW